MFIELTKQTVVMLWGALAAALTPVMYVIRNRDRPPGQKDWLGPVVVSILAPLLLPYYAFGLWLLEREEARNQRVKK